MSAIREAAQQALEVLELAQTDVHWELNSPTRKFLRKAEKTLRAALAQQEAPVELEQVNLFRCPQCNGPADNGHDRSIPPNPYFCSKCMDEPVAGIIESEINGDSRQTLDEAMRLPRAMAQAYESGYNAGVAHERERCLRLIDEHVRAVDAEDLVRAIKEGKE